MLISRLEGARALTHLGRSELAQVDDAVGIGDLSALIDTLISLDVDPDDIAMAVTGGQVSSDGARISPPDEQHPPIPGGINAYNDVVGRRNLTSDQSILGSVFKGVTIEWQPDPNDPDTVISIGTGTVVTGTAGGMGMVVLDTPFADIARLTGGRPINSDTPLLGWADQTTGSRGAPVSTKMFYANPDPEEVNAAAAALGIIDPLASSGGQLTMTEILATTTAQDSGYFYGVSTGQPVTRRVSTMIDPSGYLKVPPVFKTGAETGGPGDAWDMFIDLPEGTIRRIQQAMIDARWAPFNSTDGLWSAEWAQSMADLMALSNAKGYVLPSAPSSANFGGPLGFSQKMAGITLALEDRRRVMENNKEQLPTYIPQVRTKVNPADVTDMVQGWAKSHIGRELSDYQLKIVASKWNAQKAAQAAQAEMLAKRETYVNAGALDPNRHFDLTPEQERILSVTEVPDMSEGALAAQFSRFFKEMFADDYAQMQARARFRGDQARQGGLNQTIFSAISAGGG